MKKYSIQLIITIFIIFALAGISGQEASAYKIKIKTEKTGPNAEKMGDEMFDVAKEGASYRLKKHWKKVNFVGKEPSKKDTFTICKPYVSWCDSESYSLYPIYYFPLAVKGKIVALIEVYGRIEEPKYTSASIPIYEDYEEEVEALNRLDYLHKDYVFFLYSGITMAQGEDGKIVKLIDSAEPDCEPTDGEKFFYALDYDKKLELTIAQMDDYMTHEELMALNEKPSDPNPIIGGTDSGGEAVKTIKQADTAKPDTSIEKNFNISYGILSVSVAVGVVVLAVAFTIIRKKRNDKG